MLKVQVASNFFLRKFFVAMVLKNLVMAKFDFGLHNRPHNQAVP